MYSEWALAMLSPKAASPMAPSSASAVPWMVTVARFLWLKKALPPMEVTLFGMVSEVSGVSAALRLRSKADAPMEVRVSGRERVCTGTL